MFPNEGSVRAVGMDRSKPTCYEQQGGGTEGGGDLPEVTQCGLQGQGPASDPARLAAVIPPTPPASGWNQTHWAHTCLTGGLGVPGS